MRPLFIPVLALAMLALPLASHEGHDHAEAPAPVATLATPQRLADGTVHLPKASQRQLAVRTIVAQSSAVSRAIELPGLVAMDPNAGGRVQGTVAGRVEPGPRGLPVVGQAVARGQVLATLRPTVNPLDRATHGAQIAQLEADRALVGKRLARLRDLADTVPRKEIETAESELASLGARIEALSSAVAPAETLTAPVAGVIAATNVVAGQLVDAREVLFEIVDPARLRVEATGFDATLATDIASATITAGGKAVPLAFVGAGRILKEQTVPLVFRAEGSALAGLAVGQPIPVTVRTKSSATGVPVPAVALVRSASNTTIVWVKTQPERFVPRPVRVQPLDGASVLVVEGLAAGERVVTEGAALVNQVR